jgi:hypothetical protein
VRHHRLLLASLLACVFVMSASCTTFTNARPLQPGQHAGSVTVGGPLTNIPGVGPIPLPNITVEGRSGVVEHLDVNYGVHLLPALFGAPGVHVGATYQLFDQPAPVVPALAVGQRLYGFTNFVDGRRAAKAVYGLSQTDLTASWELLEHQLVYAGATAYLPFFDDGAGALAPIEPRFAPFAGVVLAPGVDWFQLNAEVRWLGPSVDQRLAVVDYIGVDDYGAIAVSVGASITVSDLIGALVNGGSDAPADEPPADESPADDAPADDAPADDAPARDNAPLPARSAAPDEVTP